MRRVELKEEEVAASRRDAVGRCVVLPRLVSNNWIALCSRRPRC